LKQTTDTLNTVALFLIIFLIINGAVIWLLDFTAQQEIFGFLASAEFVAFALIVYLYYSETPSDLSRKWLGLGFAAVAVLILLGASAFAGIGQRPAPNVQVTLYAGEISTNLYGFGNSTALTSPGPSLIFKVGDIVNVTLFNVGQMPHNWAIVNANQTNTSVLFGAQIASANVPVASNQTGNVVFSVTRAGNFFYICQVPGHQQLGMWGDVVVNP
jgi:uncharacterized cupredoxin-like copper-binding protein